MFIVMMVAFWGTTIILMGEKYSSRFGSFGTIAGSIIPAIHIIALGLVYALSGKPLALPPFTLAATVPEINISTLSFIATVVLLFAGMEEAPINQNWPKGNSAISASFAQTYTIFWFA